MITGIPNGEIGDRHIVSVHHNPAVPTRHAAKVQDGVAAISALAAQGSSVVRQVNIVLHVIWTRPDKNGRAGGPAGGLLTLSCTCYCHRAPPIQVVAGPLRLVEVIVARPATSA